MIRECVKRKFIITSFTLIVFLLTLSFPKTEKIISSPTISYYQDNKFPIYLLNKEDFVVRTSLAIRSNDSLDIAKEIIETLTLHSPKSAYIPSLFEPVLPKGTKVLSIDIQDNILKINFNNTFFNIPEDNQEQVLESLIYSLTEIESISGIMLFVESELFTHFPNQEKKYPTILTRDIGINKKYELESFKNVTKTTTYYVAKDDDVSYYVPVTLLSNDSKNKIEIVIERLKSSPYQNTNLISYLNASTELSRYEILESQVLLSFSNLLYEGMNADEMIEVVKHAIALSIKDTLDVEEVIFLN